MAQTKAWDREYEQQRFVTNSSEPQLDFKHFIKWLKKSQRFNFNAEVTALDIGCGTAKNSIYLAETKGVHCIAFDISNTALKLAKQRLAMHPQLKPDDDILLFQHNMGDDLPVVTSTIDFAFDVVSSNSASTPERDKYLRETLRVLKPGGYLFVKALCLEGDKHAQTLLEKFPGTAMGESGSYIMPETKILEKPFTEAELRAFYTQATPDGQFNILHLERKSSYTLFKGKPYKRNFWLMYLQKQTLNQA